MPEGNEIHRHAERHAEMFVGHTVDVDAPNGRFEDGAKLLNRRKLRSVEAFGKHLFYDFGKDRQLHIHLGLYGKFREGEMPFPDVRGALRLRISNARRWIELRGPTDCTVFNHQARKTLLARIGPDPLREDSEAQVTIARIRNSRTPIGALLMDQSVVSGLGNIFRAEVLFRAKLNPFLPGNTISAKTLRAIWSDAAVLMRAAMIDRRIVTTRPEDRPHPKGKVRRFETHYVYRRKAMPCFICSTPIQLREFVGRKLYWCPVCQPETAPSEKSKVTRP